MVQINCKLKLQCKSYTRASSVFLKIFWGYFNFLFSDLWDKCLVRQVSYKRSVLQVKWGIKGNEEFWGSLKESWKDKIYALMELNPKNDFQ
jgi:hypothetical protein